MNQKEVSKKVTYIVEEMERQVMNSSKCEELRVMMLSESKTHIKVVRIHKTGRVLRDRYYSIRVMNCCA